MCHPADEVASQIRWHLEKHLAFGFEGGLFSKLQRDSHCRERFGMKLVECKICMTMAFECFACHFG